MKLFALIPVAMMAISMAQEAVEEVVEGEIAGTFLAEPAAKIVSHRRRACAAAPPSESSSSSYTCCQECNKVYYAFMDFYTSYPILYPTNAESYSTWDYWTYGSGDNLYIANNTNVNFGCNGGTIFSLYDVSSIQYALDTYPVRDQAKFFIFGSIPIPVPTHGDVVVKFQANVVTSNVDANVFPAAIVDRNDYRLASGRFMVFDNTTGLEFSYMLTNNRVYVLYQRFPDTSTPPTFGGVQTPGGTRQSAYASFAFVLPVKIRRVCDYHDMAIVLHGETQEVSWHLDGREVFLLTKPGFLLSRDYLVNDLGGVEQNVWPAAVQYGVASFSALDWYPACQRSESCQACKYPFIREALVQLTDQTGYIQYNPIFGQSTGQKAIFWNPSGSPLSQHAWDQTTTINIKKLIAYQKIPVCKK